MDYEQITDRWLFRHGYRIYFMEAYVVHLAYPTFQVRCCDVLRTPYVPAYSVYIRVILGY
jgi:hypothetical protein